MTKSYNRKFILLIQFLFLSIIFFSCASTKKTKYFQDIPDSGKLKTIPSAEYTPPKVQVDDILSVIVQTVDPAATQMINAANIPVAGSLPTSTGGTSPLSAMAGSSTANPLQTSSGYLVDKDGDIDVPILGTIHAAGLTTSSLRDTITKRALKYYNNPTVIVRYANFKISITGEVAKPGVYVLPNEKVGLLDAIAMAGDLTIYGVRDNVLLIRENPDGTKTPYRINLKKSDLISSPYYYLRQNDIIYVEPGKAKAASTDAAQARNYALIGTILSIFVIYLTRK
jgi:polysaccharide export outer membrane protein